MRAKRRLMNADEDRRRAEVQGDEVRTLLWRVRSEELSRERVELAARLGDEAAKVVAGRRTGRAISWWNDREIVIEQVGEAVSPSGWRRVVASFWCDAAERVLSRFEERLPDDVDDELLRYNDLMRRALDVARRWSKGQRVSRQTFDEVLSGVVDVAEDARAPMTVVDALDATDVDRVTAIAANIEAVCLSMEEAEAEEEWQKRRLADYALGKATVQGKALQ